jgi:hypothetical protein
MFYGLYAGKKGGIRALKDRLGSASFKGDSGTDVREEHKMQEECSSVATQGDLVLTEKACRW